MIPLRSLIFGFWLFFSVFWAISAIGVKKNIRWRPWWQRSGFRLLLLVVVLLLFRARDIRHLFERYGSAFSSPVIVTIGVAICALGIAFAVWARMHLGRNWGQPMTLKEGHELVTTGPYRFIRHPIYTGILLATLGSALAVSTLWLMAFGISGAYFVYSARTEERLMMQQFPNEYAEYKKRTKALIPFFW